MAIYRPDAPLLAHIEDRIWPRRLLHVQTMTSVERTADNVYGKDKEPLYNILSYTWGRYEVPSGPSLRIHNISWNVPSINESVFTVSEFEHVLRTISQDVEYVWVDVACIDQADEAVKMQEIGRQAGIFNTANEAYVWLHGTSFHKLAKIVDSLATLAVELTTDAEFDMKYQTKVVDGTMEWDRDEKFVPACMRDSQWLAHVETALFDLYSDKWFSSLWTLQEIYLRPDAILLSRDGRQPTADAVEITSFAFIAMRLSEIESEAAHALPRSDFQSFVSPADLARLKQIQDLILRIGTGSWDNPITLYQSAGFRMTGREEDRIYGIMQVFNLKLGQSANPNQQYSLQELEVEFAQALSTRSPVLAQLFVHTRETAVGSSWRMNLHSYLPHNLRYINMTPSTTCILTPNSGNLLTFEGESCSLEDLAIHWEARAALGPKVNFFAVDNAISVTVLDAYDFSSQLPDNLRQNQEITFDKQKPVLDLLLHEYGDSLKILVLGKLLEFAPEDDSGDDEWLITEEHMDESANVALLVRPAQFDGAMVMQRIGVCVWTHFTLPEVFEHRSYILG